MTPTSQKIKPSDAKALAGRFSPIDIGERTKLDFKAGDTLRVWQRVKEGDKSRLQAFEGLVIARKHGREPGATFTMRKVASGVGVERVFPLYSPTIEKIEIVSRSNVRRAKLYYIREKAAREARKKMKQLTRVEEVMLAPSEVEGMEKEEPKVEKEEDKEEEKKADVEKKPKKEENKAEEKKESNKITVKNKK